MAHNLATIDGQVAMAYQDSDRMQAVRDAAYVVLDRMDNSKGEAVRAAIESCGLDGDRALADGIVLYLQGRL